MLGHTPTLANQFAPPGVGGALRLGGTAVVRDCSFLFNSATNRGPAIVVVVSPDITGSSFDRNELYCEAGSYQDTEEVKHWGRCPQTRSQNIRQQVIWSLAFGLVLCFSAFFFCCTDCDTCLSTRGPPSLCDYACLRLPLGMRRFVQECNPLTRKYSRLTFGLFFPFENRGGQLRAMKRCVPTVLIGIGASAVP